MNILIKVLLVFSLLASFSSFAEPLKIVNFNTMCDFCGDKEKYGPFKERLKNMADTLNRHNPDLVSLQEFSNIRQVRKVVKQVKGNYQLVFANGILANYTDPVLMINKERFTVVDQGGFWLGPNKKLPLGWTLKIPRRMQWARLLDKKTQSEFIFIGTHFDNSSENKTPSAQVINEFVKTKNLPVLFAGDTNIKTDHPGYSLLIGNELVDTFPGVDDVKFFANSPYDVHDACNKAKSPTFPECRIDHVLHTPNFPYEFKSWGVDVFRYNGSLGFVSDHRAVIVEFQ